MYAPLDQWSCTNEMLFWYLIFAIFNLNCVGVPCFTLLRIAWRSLVFVISSLKCAGILIYNLVHDIHVLSFTNSIKSKTILSSWNTYLGFLFPSYIYFVSPWAHQGFWGQTFSSPSYEKSFMDISLSCMQPRCDSSC